MLNLFFSFLIFIFGLVVGSFLNCVIYRLEKGENFLSGRSYCPHCKHTLDWKDLIPILSFLILRGKCRYCHQKISYQYPLVELVTAFLFVVAAQNQLTVNSEQLTLFNFFNFCYLLTIICFLIIIFVYDLKYYIIPDKVIYPAIALTFIYQLFGNWKLLCVNSGQIGNLQPLLNPLASGFLASLFFLLIVLVSRGRWMGVGDIKLAFLMGLVLGWPNILVALFLAFFIGAAIGIELIMSGRKTLKSEVPFGPFLVTGTFLALFFSERIIDFYLSLFLLK